MGLYDRDYTQAGPPPNLGQKFSASSMTVKLVVITVAIFLVDNLFLNNALMRWSAINDDLFTKNWRVWELLTYGFAHAPMEQTIMHIAGNMYGLWFFGREIEKKSGSREFLALYLGMIVLSGLIWCVIKLVMQGNVSPGIIGASGAITGLIVLYALHFPHRKLMLMFLPIAIPAWGLGAFIVLADIAGAAGLRQDKIAFVAHLAGAGLGALYFYSGVRLTNGLAGLSSGLQLQSKRARSNLKVHRPRDESLDLRADKILEKISRDGADSLTPAERKVLDDYSRRVRQRRN